MANEARAARILCRARSGGHQSTQVLVNADHPHCEAIRTDAPNRLKFLPQGLRAKATKGKHGLSFASTKVQVQPMRPSSGGNRLRSKAHSADNKGGIRGQKAMHGVISIDGFSIVSVGART